MANDSLYIDKNGLVVPRVGWDDSGNGLFYSVVAILLGIEWHIDKVVPLLVPNGILMRTPQNTYGQESHDNYFALAVWCALMGEKNIPRRVLLEGIKRGTFMRNTNEPKDRYKSFMGRFPHVWAAMLYAAFPNLITKAMAWLVLKIAYFPSVDVNNTSAIQLKFVGASMLKLLGDDSTLRSLVKQVDPIGERMRAYWDPGAVLTAYKTLEDTYND